MADALDIFSLLFFIQVMQSAVCFANLAILVLTVSNNFYLFNHRNHTQIKTICFIAGWHQKHANSTVLVGFIQRWNVSLLLFLQYQHHHGKLIFWLDLLKSRNNIFSISVTFPFSAFGVYFRLSIRTVWHNIEKYVFQ